MHPYEGPVWFKSCSALGQYVCAWRPAEEQELGQRPSCMDRDRRRVARAGDPSLG